MLTPNQTRDEANKDPIAYFSKKVRGGQQVFRKSMVSILLEYAKSLMDSLHRVEEGQDDQLVADVVNLRHELKQEKELNKSLLREVEHLKAMIRNQGIEPINRPVCCGSCEHYEDHYYSGAMVVRHCCNCGKLAKDCGNFDKAA